ncbi:hypothetical protein [Paenibacillus sp. FSL K6-2859]|uniref:hypothetical protein n=1 Tax=Paenibacillus sp. FSL K6-2859 TaxID=2921482 RepID=UPI0030F89F0F
MEKLLYYPGFEIEDERWLKFALLYLEEINTIVPLDGDNYISEVYKRLERETGLLRRYRPAYLECEKSSEETIIILEKFLQNPIRNFDILGNLNVLEFWRDERNHNYELYFSKFSYDFERYCLDNGFAHRSEHGVSLPHQIALIYMSVLAYNIGTHNNICVITDVQEQRRLSLLNQNTWSYNKRFNEIKAVKKTLELNLPRNIDDISIEEITKLRNKGGYQSKLKAFRQAVTRLNDLSGGRMSESNYIDIINQIEETKSGLTSEIVDISVTVTQVGLGIFLALGPEMNNYELIKEIAGVGMTITGSKNLIKTIHGDERRANQYLTQIRRFPKKRNLF